MRRLAVVFAVAVTALQFAAPATAGSFGPGAVEIVPGSTPTGPRNCIPFGTNTRFGFTGMVYRNIAPFTLNPGDEIRFDLAAPTGEPIRRDIYFATLNTNPQPWLYGGRFVSVGVRALGWTQVASAADLPKNAHGNAVKGDYELTFKATARFSFPGGGLAVGFAGSPPMAYGYGNCERDQVQLVTYYGDKSGNFYSRFYFKEHLTLGVLDTFFPQGGADNGELIGIVIVPRPSFTIDVTTFIPAPYVDGPPQARCGRGSLLLFEGDGRGFSPASMAFRTNQQVQVVADASIDPDGLKDDTAPVNRVGETKSFARDALDDGVLNHSDEDTVLGDCHLLHERATASTEGWRVAVNRVGPRQVLARFAGSGTNPLVRGACAIDWDLTVTIDDSGERPRVTILGDHDGFPAYEVYVDSELVYQYDPGPFPYPLTSLLRLCGGMDVPVERALDLAG